MCKTAAATTLARSRVIPPPPSTGGTATVAPISARTILLASWHRRAANPANANRRRQEYYSALAGALMGSDGLQIGKQFLTNKRPFAQNCPYANHYFRRLFFDRNRPLRSSLCATR